MILPLLWELAARLVLLPDMLLGCAALPPMIEVIAAARAAVKLGSAVMAAVAAVTVSASEFGCCWIPC